MGSQAPRWWLPNEIRHKLGASDESVSSGSNFQPEDEDEGGFYDVELEDDEPDTELVKKKEQWEKRKEGSSC